MLVWVWVLPGLLTPLELLSLVLLLALPVRPLTSQLVLATQLGRLPAVLLPRSMLLALVPVLLMHNMACWYALSLTITDVEFWDCLVYWDLGGLY